MSVIKQLDHAATRLLTPAFRAGREEVDFSDYERDVFLGHEVAIEPVRALLDESMARFTSDQGTECDAWLAPRLHYALRLTRREASNRGVWRWLGCVAAPDYVRWRWGTTEKEPPSDRFAGPERKHTLGRLWWMAELFRDGPDYAPASAAMMNQDIPNNLFRMDVAHHRPTVQAAVHVLDGRSGREANALAKAINAAATTLLVDVIAPDEPRDADAVARWVQKSAEVDARAFFDLAPAGPDDPRVPPSSVETMRELLEALLAEAPVRGRA